VKTLIDILHPLRTDQMSKYPWKSTGNEWLSKVIPNYKPNIVIWPSHYFIPTHYDRAMPNYNGTDKVYAHHLWGSTGGGVDYREGVK